MTYDYETTVFCLDPLPFQLEWEMLPHIIPTSWSQCLPCFVFFVCFVLFFTQSLQRAPSYCQVSESSCSLCHVSIPFCLQWESWSSPSTQSRPEVKAPLHRLQREMHRGDDLSEKNQVLLMEHSETNPFVTSLAPEKSFCLEIFIFCCLDACAGLSDDFFFFSTQPCIIISIFDILPSL